MEDNIRDRAAEIVAALRAECGDCSDLHWCKDGVNGVGLYCPIQDAANLIEQLTALQSENAELRTQHRVERCEDAGYDCAELGRRFEVAGMTGHGA